LTYTVLSDAGSRLADALGITFDPFEEGLAARRALGVDIRSTRADGATRLSMPTVLIVAPDHIVRFVDIRPDYSGRPEVDEILAASKRSQTADKSQEKPMHATAGSNNKTRVGDVFPTLDLAATSGQLVRVPDPAGDYVHLQLRRFAGCPICNLHLRSIVARHDEIRSHGVREVVVFHSTAAELAKHEAELPFPLIPDPERGLYRRLGVERRLPSLLSIRALRAAIAGLTAALGSRGTKRGALGPVKPTGGRLGLPADFLIAADGRIAALKYGQHAYDQWTVDELLAHAHRVPA
jgi:peroxiredoxin